MHHARREHGAAGVAPARERGAPGTQQPAAARIGHLAHRRAAAPAQDVTGGPTAARRRTIHAPRATVLGSRTCHDPCLTCVPLPPSDGGPSSPPVSQTGVCVFASRVRRWCCRCRELHTRRVAISCDARAPAHPPASAAARMDAAALGPGPLELLTLHDERVVLGAAPPVHTCCLVCSPPRPGARACAAEPTIRTPNGPRTFVGCFVYLICTELYLLLLTLLTKRLLSHIPYG